MSLIHSKLPASLLALLFGAAVALAFSAACSNDDAPTPTYYIGVNDASPPRLGPNDDAGTE